MPAERRLEGIAVEVGLEDEQAALRAPIPLVGPVAGALLVARSRARRPRGFRWLAPRRDDGIALLLGNRWRQRLVRGASADEIRQTSGADNPDKLRAEAAALWGVVATRLETQCQSIQQEDPIAQPRVRRVHGKVVRRVHSHVE